MKTILEYSDKKLNRIFFVAVVVIIIISLLIAVVANYLKSFNEALLEENSNYLSEITAHITTNVHLAITDLQKSLESMGLTVASLPNDYDGNIYLNSLKTKYNFEYVGVASNNGDFLCTMKTEEGNISNQDYYQRAMGGESTINYVPVKIFKNKAISGILLSTPVYMVNTYNQKPVAVMVAMLDIKKFSQNLNITGFNGKGTTYIIDGNGNIILQTKIVKYSNLFSTLHYVDSKNGSVVGKITDDLSKKTSGSVVYSYLGIDKFMHYQDLGINDWSVVSVVEKDVITSRSMKLTRQLSMVGVAIVILFPLLLLFAISALEISKNSRETANAKTAFLANMSHEIRTPMNAIVGISELLLREDINSKQRNYVLNIVNAGNGLLTIINDILDLSKIESGKFTIVDEEYELESLIYDITTIASVKIADKPIEFLWDLAPNLPKYVIGDMIRVKQVLLNIVGNAIKFTKTGYIKVGIQAQFVDGQAILRIVVKDTGSGIEKQDLSKLFISFNQIDTHKNHSLEGTGLGLVISKRLCEMMGGNITVESEYGKGSTFIITIKQISNKSDVMMKITNPEKFNLLLLEKSDILRKHFNICLDRLLLPHYICKDFETFDNQLSIDKYTHILLDSKELQKLSNNNHNNVNLAKVIVLLNTNEQSQIEEYTSSIMVSLFILQLTAALGYTKTYSNFTKHSGIDVFSITPMPFVRILIVDDNEVNLQIASGLMSPYHMDIHCALSGKAAVSMIKDNNYDLVFMDHMMPEMDGVETVKCIRDLSDEKKNSLPVIALTANVTQDARKLFVASGFQDFLSKPVETVQLNVILKKWLKEKNDERALLNPEAAKKFKREIEKKDCKSVLDKISDSFADSTHVDFAAGADKMGSIEVYCSVLDTYCRSANEKLTMLPQLVETDLERFTIEIHGLKGSSGGVSAVFIAKAASELERLAKEKRDLEIKNELPKFMQALENTLEEINGFLMNCRNTQNPVKDTCVTKEIKEGRLSVKFIGLLKDAFMNFDTEKLKVIFEETKMYSYEQYETQLLKKLEEFYEAYDFDSPILMLEEYEQSTTDII